ncbi:MAG: hypothetical protein HYX24_00470 [Candidatus Aenigmarchaeota archaeon]|nr:hypothetical protein [Candidatus Aenigmarchaeota archaeon]
MKQIDRIREYSKRTPVFDTKSAVRLIGDRDYAYLLLNCLLKAGEIKRLTKVITRFMMTLPCWYIVLSLHTSAFRMP